MIESLLKYFIQALVNVTVKLIVFLLKDKIEEFKKNQLKKIIKKDLKTAKEKKDTTDLSKTLGKIT